MEKLKLMICIPTYSWLFPTDTVESLLRLKKTCPTMIQFIERQRIDKSRNWGIKQMLDSWSDYLLFIDDDNPVPENTIELLMENKDKDMICVPIPTRNPNDNWFHDLCIFRSKYVWEINVYENINKIDLSEWYLIEVDACWMWCTMISRKVCEEVYKKYNWEPFAFWDTTYVIKEWDVNKNRRTTWEDVEYCERAKKLGFKIFCDTRIRPSHIWRAMKYKFNNNYII